MVLVVVMVVVLVGVVAYLHGQIWMRGKPPGGRNRRWQRGRTPCPLPKIHCGFVAISFELLHAYLSPGGINVGAEPISVRRQKLSHGMLYFSAIALNSGSESGQAAEPSQ